MTPARSYIPTEKLIALRSSDPELAAQIEDVCQAVRALRGFAMLQEAERVMQFSAAALAPFVTPIEAFDEVQRLKGMSRLPAEIRPEEIEEYKRLQRFLNSTRAVQRIVSQRKGG